MAKTTTAEHQGHLLKRVGALREWFTATLKAWKQRDAATIDAAGKAYLAWVEEGEGSGDTFGALTRAWEMVPPFVNEWVRNPGTIAEDFPLTASPPWEPIEVALIAGFVCATVACVLLETDDTQHAPVITLLYGDALEARAYWIGLVMTAREKKLGRIEATKKAASARHAKDPKQAAKAAARALWVEWQEGNHPKLRTDSQYAQEVMRRWPVLVNEKTITQWSTAWRKQAREEKTQGSGLAALFS